MGASLPVLSDPITVAQCSRYRGARETCRAEVDVETLRDEEGRLPCVVISGRTGVIGCDELDLPRTAAGEPGGRMAKLLAELEAGRCPTCSRAITGEATDGDDVVALPCRHVLLRAPLARPARPPEPRPISSGAAAQDRWERDHDDDRGPR